MSTNDTTSRIIVVDSIETLPTLPRKGQKNKSMDVKSTDASGRNLTPTATSAVSTDNTSNISVQKLERSVNMLMRTAHAITPIYHAIANIHYILGRYTDVSLASPVPMIYASRPIRDTDAWIRRNRRGPVIVTDKNTNVLNLAPRDMDVVVSIGDETIAESVSNVFRTRILASEPLPEFIGATPSELAYKLSTYIPPPVFDVGNYLGNFTNMLKKTNSSLHTQLSMTSTLYPPMKLKSINLKSHNTQIDQLIEMITFNVNHGNTKHQIHQSQITLPSKIIPRDIDFRTLVQKLPLTNSMIDIGNFLHGIDRKMAIQFGNAYGSILLDNVTGDVKTFDQLSIKCRQIRRPFYHHIRRLMSHGLEHRVVSQYAFSRTMRLRSMWTTDGFDYGTTRPIIRHASIMNFKYNLRMYPNIPSEPLALVKLDIMDDTMYIHSSNDDGMIIDNEIEFISSPSDVLMSISGPRGQLAPLQARKFLSALLKSAALGSLFHDILIGMGYNSETDPMASDMLRGASTITMILVLDVSSSSTVSNTNNKSIQIKNALMIFCSYIIIRIQSAIPTELISLPSSSTFNIDNGSNLLRGYPLDDDLPLNSTLIRWTVNVINGILAKRGLTGGIDINVDDIVSSIKSVLSHLPALENNLQRTRQMISVLDRNISLNTSDVSHVYNQPYSHISSMGNSVCRIDPLLNTFVDERWNHHGMVLETSHSNQTSVYITAIPSSELCDDIDTLDFLDQLVQRESSSLRDSTHDTRLIDTQLFNELESIIANQSRSRMQALVDVTLDVMINRHIGTSIYKMNENPSESELIVLIGPIRQLARGNLIRKLDMVAEVANIDVTKFEIAIVWHIARAIAWIADKLGSNVQDLLEYILGEMLTGTLLYEPSRVAQVRADLREIDKQSKIRKLNALDDSMRALLMNVGNHVPEELLDVYNVAESSVS